jgi:hypothetical protein
MRPLVLLGAFFLLRAMLPRGSRRSPTATSPYINGLDGAIPTQQLSSMLDEVTPYQSWGGQANGAFEHRCQDRPSRDQHIERVQVVHIAWRPENLRRYQLVSAMLQARSAKRLS